MNIRDISLTREQHSWLNGWLELWGAWIYSGRLDKRQSNIIAQFMVRAEPQSCLSRPVCSDDDGLLISRVVDSVMYTDKKAFCILLSYYVHGSSEYAIAVYSHRVANPRKIATRGGNRLRKPSLATCRREVKEILSVSQYLIYFPLLKAMNGRKKVAKIQKVA